MNKIIEKNTETNYHTLINNGLIKYFLQIMDFQ